MSELMRPGARRPLSSGEASLAAEVFGDSLSPGPVRILAAPRPWARAFVAGRWLGRDLVIFPVAEARQDFASASTPLRAQGDLIHELTHVWQAQGGVNLLTAKLRAGDRAESYAYHLSAAGAWEGLNIEQQARLVEHLFLSSRGVATPWPHARLASTAPFGRG